MKVKKFKKKYGVCFKLLEEHNRLVKDHNALREENKCLDLQLVEIDRMQAFLKKIGIDNYSWLSEKVTEDIRIVLEVNYILGRPKG